MENLINSLKGCDKVRVLFVCLGNICRSPAAQGIMQHIVDKAKQNDRFILDSAGLYGGHAGELPDSRMRQAAFQHGYRLEHRSRPVTSSDFENFDIVVAMDNSNYDRLKALAPTVEDEAKVVKMISFCTQHKHHTYIPDPYYEGMSGFHIVIELLEDACQGLFDALK